MLFFSYFLKSRYSKFFNYSSNFYNLVFFLQSHNYSSRNIINSNLFIRSLLDDTTLTEQELLDKFTLYSYENKDVLYSKNLYEFCVSPRIISIVYKKIKGVDFLNSEELNFIYSLNSKLIGESKFLVQIDISSKTLNSNELNSIKSKIDLGLFNCLLLIYSSNNIPLKYKNNFIKFTLTLKQIDLLIAYGFDIKVVTDLNITQQKSLDKPNYYLNLLECFDLEFNLFLKIFLFSSTDKVFLKNWFSIFSLYLKEINIIFGKNNKLNIDPKSNIMDEELNYLVPREFDLSYYKDYYERAREHNIGKISLRWWHKIYFIFYPSRKKFYREYNSNIAEFLLCGSFTLVLSLIFKPHYRLMSKENLYTYTNKYRRLNNKDFLIVSSILIGDLFENLNMNFLLVKTWRFVTIYYNIIMKIKDVNFLKLFKMLLISGLLYYKFDNSSLFIKKYPYINYYQDFFKEFYYNLLFYEFDLFMVQNPRIVSYFRYKDSILLVFDNITEKDKNLIIDKLTISFYLPVENINFDCIHYNKGDGKKLDLSMFKEIHFIKK